MSNRSAAERAGDRAARNTAARGAGEIVGKLASLVLFAVLGREAGESGLGAFVFAFSFLQIVFVPIDLGYDRWLIRQVARDRAIAAGLLWNVLALKLLRTLPVFVLALPLLLLMGADSVSREAVYVLCAGVLFESLGRTVFAVFTAYERSELLAVALVVQRVLAAALGLAALAAGHGVIAVAAAYSVGAAAGLAVGLVLLRRVLGPLRPHVKRAGWGAISRGSLPFSVQDVFTVIMFRVDAVILSIIVASAAVGRYGAAYRLFESTLFVTIAMAGAFSAMYTYLGPDTQPTIRAVFQRSIKLALASLMPIAVAFGVLAVPITRVIYGDGLADAAAPLRILAPSVVLLGIVTLAASLYVSRRDPRGMVRVTAAMAIVNVLLNLALIPPLEDTGAAIAMTTTEALYCFVALRMAVQAAGGADWVPMLASPIVAGALCAVPMVLLDDHLAAALVAGGLVYVTAFAALERVIAPGDLRFATSMLRRALGRPAAA